MAVILPCSMRNFKTIALLKWMLWPIWVNKILWDLILRWVSDGYPVSHNTPVQYDIACSIMMIKLDQTLESLRTTHSSHSWVSYGPVVNIWEGTQKGPPHIDELVQERHNSSALTMVLCLSCTNPSIFGPHRQIIKYLFWALRREFAYGGQDIGHLMRVSRSELSIHP